MEINDDDGTTTRNTRPTKKQNTNQRKKNQSKEERCSRVMSWALRHAAIDLGLSMLSDGFVPVNEILHHKHAKLKGLTLEVIQTTVASNEKKRFSIKEDEAGVLHIRANQGHSIAGIDPNALLTLIAPQELAELTVVHGTYYDTWENHIRSQGLSKMKRNHIHFAAGLPQDDKTVISGMRKTCTIYIYLDGRKCSHDGIAFFRSDNRVILTAGVHDKGFLPPVYFSHVVSSKGELLLDNRVTTYQN